MNRKQLLLTIAKIVGIAALAAFITKYEDENNDEATQSAQLGKSLPMWTLGFAVSAVGGFAALSSLSGLLAVLGAVGLAITVLALFLGAGAEARELAEDRVDPATNRVARIRARLASIIPSSRRRRRQPPEADFVVPDVDDGVEVLGRSDD